MGIDVGTYVGMQVLTLYTEPNAPEPITAPLRSSDSLINLSFAKSGFTTGGTNSYINQSHNRMKVGSYTELITTDRY